MKSNVKITANPTTGLVFNANENLGKDGKQYGFIRVEQTTVDMSQQVLTPRTRSAIKSISQESFEKTKDFFREGTEISGTIVRKETIDVNIHKNGEKSGYSPKRAGSEEDAPVCRVGNSIVYQATELVDDVNAPDVLVQHTNIEEIKAYQAAKKVALNA